MSCRCRWIASASVRDLIAHGYSLIDRKPAVGVGATWRFAGTPPNLAASTHARASTEVRKPPGRLPEEDKGGALRCDGTNDTARRTRRLPTSYTYKHTNPSTALTLPCPAAGTGLQLALQSLDTPGPPHGATASIRCFNPPSLGSATKFFLSESENSQNISRTCEGESAVTVVRPMVKVSGK